MKKIIALLLVLVVLLPAQAFAADSKPVSASYIEKFYFGPYREGVKEVRAAQKNLPNILCTDVKALTEQSKVSVAKYNSAVKSKASKEVITKAKEERDRDKKSLSASKSKCSAAVKVLKQGSDKELALLARQKAGFAKSIKTHLDGKDNIKEADFDEAVSKYQLSIDGKFKSILRSLKTGQE